MTTPTNTEELRAPPVAEVAAILDNLEQHSPSWVAKLRAALGSQWEENRALKAKLAAAQEDADKWRGLMSCDRIRIMGRTLDNKHMGVEFWTKHRSKHPSKDYPQEKCRKLFNEFAREALRADGETDNG